MEGRGVIHLSVRSLGAERSRAFAAKAVVAVPSNKPASGRAFAMV